METNCEEQINVNNTNRYFKVTFRRLKLPNLVKISAFSKIGRGEI